MESNAKQADENLALDDLEGHQVVALMLLDFLGRSRTEGGASRRAGGLPAALGDCP
jgi:hypothetical protein